MLGNIAIVCLLVFLTMAVGYVRSAPLFREEGKGGNGFTVVAFIVMGIAVVGVLFG